MSEKKQILLVDDSPNEIRVLMENLKQDYAVLAATSGEHALTSIETSVPDLVLLDVTMEPMDGYETCEALLKRIPDLPVIFVSANTRSEEILKGFDVGGRDYITKPIDPKVLKTKIKLVFDQLERKKQLAKEKAEVSELAMAAMSSAGDLSVVLNFLREASKVNESQELVALLCKAAKDYGLEVGAQIRDGDEVGYNASTSQVPLTPIEQGILNSSTNIDGRLMERGARLVLVFESVSMLVKNLPESEERKGQLRDYLMILAENAHDTNLRLRSQQSLNEQRVAMVLEAVRDSKETLQSIHAFQSKYKQDSIRIMDELLEDIEEHFFSMGLSEDQEGLITKIITDKLNEGVTHMEAGLEVDAKMQHLADSLDELTRSF